MYRNVAPMLQVHCMKERGTGLQPEFFPNAKPARAHVVIWVRFRHTKFYRDHKWLDCGSVGSLDQKDGKAS
jgi:hypothetical protein